MIIFIAIIAAVAIVALVRIIARVITTIWIVVRRVVVGTVGIIVGVRTVAVIVGVSPVRTETKAEAKTESVSGVTKSVVGMSVVSVKAVAVKTVVASTVNCAEAAPVKPSGSAMESTK